MSALKEERIREAIIEQATEWYVRNADGALSANENEEFLSWLCTSPQHTREYLAIARMSGGFREIITQLGLDPVALSHHQDDPESTVVAFNAQAQSQLNNKPSRRYSTSTVWKGLAAMLVLAVGASLIWDVNIPWLPHTITVDRGEQRTVQLGDGSVMHINANSELKVRFGSGERLIELRRGQALFEVARDAHRPFRVVAGSTEVVAVGTQFDVYRRDAHDVRVTVVQGRVDVVDRSRQVDDSSSVDKKGTRLRLNAGERTDVMDGKVPLRSVPVDVKVALAWVRREVMFEGQSLREVTEEFNRYSPVRIEIDDPSLQELPVSGVFNAYDSDALLDFLKQYSVQVERKGDVIHIRRRSISGLSHE